MPKLEKRKMSVSQIETMLGILELYDIPVTSMDTAVYEDCISILERKRVEYEQQTMRVVALLTRLAGM